MRPAQLCNREFVFAASILESDLKAGFIHRATLSICAPETPTTSSICEVMGRKKVFLDNRPARPDLNRDQTTPGESSVGPDKIVVNLGDHTAVTDSI